MYAIIAIIVVVIVIIVIAAVVTGGGVLKKSADQGDEPIQDLHGPGALRYHPPAGQDPAIVVAALNKDGFEAASESVRGRTLVIVSGAEADRERVRQAIGHASGSAFTDPESVQGGVRFEDER